METANEKFLKRYDKSVDKWLNLLEKEDIDQSVSHIFFDENLTNDTIVNFVDKIAKYTKIKIKSISFNDIDSLGTYDMETKSVNVNPKMFYEEDNNNFKNRYDLVNTIFHELRHAYQYQNLKYVSSLIRKKMKQSDKKYINDKSKSYDDPTKSYNQQFVELDARISAFEITNNFYNKYEREIGLKYGEKDELAYQSFNNFLEREQSTYLLDKALIGVDFSNKYEFVVPEGVESISGYFSRDNNLVSMIIPSSMKKVMINYFGDCLNLKNVTLKQGVEEIDIAAFSKNLSLETVVIPDSVTKIGMNAFQNCLSLKEIVIPGSVKVIESGVFKNAKAENIILQPGVEKIEYHAFYGCDINEIIIPETIKEIAENAFEVSSLNTIVIPSSIEKIGIGAFKDTECLEKIKIEDGVANICPMAFTNSGLKEITFPKSLKVLEECLCLSCLKLENAVIEKGCEKIKNAVFYGCENLTSVTIPNSVVEMGQQIFKDCDKLKTVTLETDDNKHVEVDKEYFSNPNLPITLVRDMAKMNILPKTYEEFIQNNPEYHFEEKEIIFENNPFEEPTATDDGMEL